MSDDGQGGYLIVEKDGTKHLPTQTGGKPDHRLMGAAWAALHGGYRGNKYEGPGKQEAISKLKALYKSEGMETPDQASESLSFVIALGEIAAAGLVRMPVAITGSWVHPATERKINITLADLRQAKENFEKKANGEINVDYDHASAIPNFAGGPRPSAGRVIALHDPEAYTDPQGVQRQIMWGDYEPTEMARELIRKREYRYISPVLDREGTDKASGESQGMTITTIALTNTPVLEEMPEIVASEQGHRLYEISGSGIPRPGVRNSDAAILAERSNNMALPKATLKCAADGTHEVHGPDGPAFQIDHKHLQQYAAEHAGMAPAEDGDDKASQVLSAIGMPQATLDQVRERLTLASQFEAQKKTSETRALILKECLSDQGAFNEDALDRLIEQGKVAFADTVGVKRAVRLVAQYFAAGKLTPAQRKAAIQVACSDADSAKALFSDLKAFVPLESKGAARAETGSASDDLAKMAEARAAEKKIDYAVALSEVSRENRELAEQARQATIAQRQGQ